LFFVEVITLEVQIKKLTDRVDSNICHIPNDIFAALNLSTEVPYKINLGQSYDYSYIVPNEQLGNCMYFSKSVFKKLMLFQGITLNIWRNEEEIYLGPVVGIFVTKSHRENQNWKTFSFRTKAWRGSQWNELSCILLFY
jgi:hypothetical protein